MSSEVDQRASKARAAAEAAGQGHVFEHWDALTDAEKEKLLSDVEDVTPEQEVEWTQHGFRLIAEGRVAVLLLAGGQGTRLGSSAPKGCYDIQLPSHKSLFQLQAERLLRLQQLAAEAMGTAAAAVKPLQWYIMTSAFTHAETIAHFEAGGYFGLQPGQVHFFQQGFLPCLTEEGALGRGKLILEARGSLAKAPDGNGGVYLSLARSGALDAMAAAGVECLDCYCVDNALARLGDPRFVGYCHGGARADVGVFARRRVGEPAATEQPSPSSSSPSLGPLAVLEYSELDPSLASAANPATGQLYYNWSNICMHYFSVAWLRRVADSLLGGGGTPYHVARKRIPSVSGPVPGIKLELFIFDTFAMAAGERTALVEVERSEEFAPVKNAPGSATDSPDTARAAVLALHAGWVRAAGGAVAAAEGVEVSPLVSYGGEGLAALVAGKTYDSSLVPELQQPQPAAP
ncbi:hypothetical protein GPECTOR_4g718 [Gonium pectorale]|uniref:UDP-N-acetylglucosamine diphosphorylase n=1 Tax=Gonium pectorale TaxID=33097 RepID=A0A150GY68_GONPE|nr:hypothetical protein GPECTOR_4g718 [Gonium pectorale]|eukprot:KXZ54652.1 hypothetical protein GPECTOR_4g718 [Gonium pectorale]